MNIGIVGPGAIGLLMAYYIENAGVKPTLFYRNRKVAKFVKEVGGPRVKIQSMEYPLNSDILYLGSPVDKKYDILFITTKAYDVKLVTKYLGNLLKEGGLAVSVQNGIGSLEILEEKLGQSNVLSAVVTYGATRYEYVKSELKGVGEVILGQRVRPYNTYVYRLRDLLMKGGLNIKIVNEIDSYRWLKVLVNSAIGPVTTIFKMENRVLIELKEARLLANMILREGKMVLDAMDIRLPRNPFKETFRIVRSTADNYSSMLQDILSKKRTEIDYINGAIVEHGKKHGVLTPINETIIYIVKGLGRL